jgi:MATE family multidrug resistance protein
MRGELAATLRLALPLIIAQLSASGQGVIECLLAGHLEAHVLGAVAIGVNLSSIPLTLIIGIMYALPPSVAQLDGAGECHKIASLFRQALWLSAGLGLVMLCTVRWCAPALVTLAGVPEPLAVDVDAFLRAVSLAMPFIGLFVACRGVSDGLSMPHPTMVLSLSGLVLLVPFGYVLMYGALGLPRFGAAGMGYAAAIVDALQFVAFLTWLRFGPRYRGLGWSAGRRRPDPQVILKLLRVGAPIGVSLVMDVGLFSFITLAIGRFGEIATASHQVALNVATVVFKIPLGVASAITVRVGNAVGRGDGAGVQRTGLAGVLIVLATQTVSSVLMLTLSATIAGLYSHDASVIAGASVLMVIAGVFQFFDGLQVAANGALRGLKDTRVPMFITLIAYWGIGMPLGLYLAFSQALRAPGMWAGLTIGVTVAAALLLTRFSVLTRMPIKLGPRPCDWGRHAAR